MKIPADNSGQKHDHCNHGYLCDAAQVSGLNHSQAEVTEEDIFKTMSVCFAIEKATHQSGSVVVRYI